MFQLWCKESLNLHLKVIGSFNVKVKSFAHLCQPQQSELRELIVCFCLILTTVSVLVDNVVQTTERTVLVLT